MKKISAKTKLVGLLGKPVTHSLSPELHMFLADKMDDDLVYLAFCPEREDLKAVFDGALKMGVCGFNVTSPYKVDAFHIIEEIDPEARKMGNINTVVNRGGKWFGTNTDGEGFIRALCYRGHSVSGKHILLMGSGGTARTLSYKLAQNGAASITLLSRKENPLEEISVVREDFPMLSLHSAWDKNKHYDIVINCTPLGMEPLEDRNPVPEGFCYAPDMLCCDLIYNPEKTLFLKEAEAHGASTMNGLLMFLYQGLLAYEHFTGKTLSTEICEALFKEFIKE